LYTDFLKEKAGFIAYKLFYRNLIEADAVGLGTGSTVKFFIELLIKDNVLRGKDIYVSSIDTLLYLRSKGLESHTPEELSKTIDIYVDGFDEASLKMDLVKGRGGAFHWEKILAKNSKLRIYIADYTKWSNSIYLHFKPIPVEVAREKLLKVYEIFKNMGLNPRIRSGAGRDGPVITDSGNYIIDLYPGMVENPVEFEKVVMSVEGVIDTGIFPSNLVDYIVLTGPNEWEVRVFSNNRKVLEG